MKNLEEKVENHEKRISVVEKDIVWLQGTISNLDKKIWGILIVTITSLFMLIALMVVLR
jgi:hypothetical protein